MKRIKLGLASALTAAAISNLNANVENVEFLADKVTREGDVLHAQGNVLAYSQNYFITAKEAKYDQKNEIVELFEDVRLIRGKDEAVRANYARLNLKTDEVFLDSSFSMNQTEEVWIQSDESCSTNKEYSTKGSIVSSCNVQDPDWHISYTSGWLNKESKWMHVFNPVFHVGNYPVFYMPYFAFPADDTRRSGLLFPTLGYGKKEGFIYKQPIYIAEYDEWDLQLDPQVRSERGAGISTTFRFVDSPYSNGKIKWGYFADKKSFQEKEELKNQKHRGWEIEYERDKLAGYLAKGDFTEGLLVDFKYPNDVEYFELTNNTNSGYGKSSIVQSRANYYISTKEHYFGAYAKYYVDLAKIGTEYENKTTVQELPALQYHSYLDTFLTNNFTYSLDTKFHNYTRNVGATARQYEINAPIGVNFMLPGNWANISLTENFYATHVDYGSNLESHNGKYRDKKNDDYFRNYHLISLTSDLAKNYDWFYHTINFKFDYLKPGGNKGNLTNKLISESYHKVDSDGQILDSLVQEDNFLTELDSKYTTENFNAGLTQYFYTSEGDKLIRHSISQEYDMDAKKFGNLDNRINLYLGDFTVYNYAIYSNKYKEFTKVQTGATANMGIVSTGITHSYEKKFTSQNVYTRTSYITGKASLQLPYQYKLYGSFGYDKEYKYWKSWTVGLTHNRKCWNFNLYFKRVVEPKNKANGLEGRRTEAVYLTIGFYPIGGVNSHITTLSQDTSEQ